MTIRAYALDLPGSPGNHGVVLLNSLTDLPIPMSVYTFHDLEDAENFIAWVSRKPLNPRRLRDEQVVDFAVEWSASGREAARKDTA